MPMVITDPRRSDNPIVLANQAFLDLVGYGADEVLGRNCRFLQGEGTSIETVDQLRTELREQREFTLEILNYRKDGTGFWNQLHVSPIHDESGTLLYYFASQDDVTEFRKVQGLEATERRLLKEVDHRSRNVLAVVNGIVRLSRSDDAALYAATIQQRVQALAGAHTLLSERGWQEVDLAEVVRQQTDLLDPSRVTLHGPVVMIPVLTVQPIALVVHELLLNATTHGALATPEGKISITWRPLDAYGGFDLVWAETTPGLTGPGDTIGFGTAMTEGMIKRQLRGTVRRVWSDDGMTVLLTVPGGLPAQGDAPK